LKLKFSKFPVYKKAIIAYNGGIRVNKKTKKLKWLQDYWKKFVKERKNVDLILGNEQQTSPVS